MTKQVWFMSIAAQVKGPLSKEEVALEIEKNKNQTVLVWGRGLREWLKPDDWRQMHAHERSFLGDEVYFLRLGDINWGPCNREQTVEIVRNKISLVRTFQVRLDGETQWSSIYTHNALRQKLGLTVEGQRAPMLGDASLEVDSHLTSGKVMNISEGGMAMRLPKAIAVGAVLPITVRSPLLPADFNATVEVIHSAEKGATGFRFRHLTQEAKALIVEYLKRFQSARKIETGLPG